MRFTGVLTCGVGNRRGRMGRIRWTTTECGALAAHRGDGVLGEHEQPGLVAAQAEAQREDGDRQPRLPGDGLLPERLAS
jgi:hypothetical protein